MIEKIRIENFKNFKEFEYDGFARVNLIAGKNNVGKTNLLEALYLTENEFRPIGFVSVYQMRSNNPQEKVYLTTPELLNNYLETSFNSLFKKLDSAQNSISVTVNLKSEFKVSRKNYVEGFEKDALGNTRVSLSPVSNEIFDPQNPNLCFEILSPQFRLIKFSAQIQRELFRPDLSPMVVFLNPSISILDSLTYTIDKIKQLNLFSELIHSLNDILELEILDIHPFRIEGQPFGEIKFQRKDGEWSSFSDYGFGTNRIVYILLLIFSSKGKSVFLDETDIGIHFSLQEDFWKLIFKVSKALNVQIFATTHSRDCIEAFAKVSNQFKGEGKYLRLQEKGGKIFAVDYSTEELDSAVEFNSEMR